MSFVMAGKPERSVASQSPLLLSDLFYLSIDLILVIEVVGKSTIYLGGSELGELTEDILSRQPTTVLNRY
jgi:hypothetical protein